MSTLEELDVSYTEIGIDKLLELKSLICNYLFVNYLKKEEIYVTFPNPNSIFFGRKGGILGNKLQASRSICKCAVFEFRIRIKQRTKENINGHPSFQ